MDTMPTEYTECQMLEYDAEDLSYSDALVMLIADDRSITRTRLQKISLLYDEVYGESTKIPGNSAYFFEGYSDGIDESAENLVDTGMLSESREGYMHTLYGSKLKEYMINKESGRNKDRSERIECIKAALSDVPDRNIVGLTYCFYGESAVNAGIKCSVERLNSHSEMGGIPLSEIKKDDFEEHLRKGTEIVITSRKI
ncbi:MAG: hypothetical protein LBT41_02125 [Candidatus Methanoplasma sp.]|nr:hypothetical protein [Candidatus Methanoplasma sp.]